MDPNDYRKIPKDSRYDPFGDEELTDYLNWDQPEDDIVGARLAQQEKEKEKREAAKKSRIIREDAYPEVEEREEQTADGRRQTAEEEREEEEDRGQRTEDSEETVDDRRQTAEEIDEEEFDDEDGEFEEFEEDEIEDIQDEEDEIVPESIVVPQKISLIPEKEAKPHESGLKITRLAGESDGKNEIQRSPQPAGTPVSTTPILEVKNLCIQFGRAKVLRDINLTIRRGETVAIIGESGCGKTVLLKTLIGLLTPTEGEVLFDGMDINTLPEKELTRQRTRYGFVFQQAALFDSMTIYENISFPLNQHTDYSEKDMREIVVQLLGEVGLPNSVLEKKPAELSGGMRKRVGFARALAMGPEIMLYDEPTTGLDPIMSDVINELMIRSKKLHDVSGVVVTHDMVSARKVADRIIMLYPIARLKPHEPQILFDGPPREIDQTQDPRVTQFLKGEAGDRRYEP